LVDYSELSASSACSADGAVFMCGAARVYA
jgi:hypothetical protein